MGMAEVNLYFDNSDGVLPVDYNEVCVTRRLYRSGESEYLINKQKCRLRDVKELFMDTGIGTSAYSFIEQGKVEALLAAKPHERRIVFEEAAGISKYKARRKETLSRLDRTEQYLLRVDDIVEEVEKRIRSVSRQAQSAKRFQRLTEELNDTRGKLYITRWNNENERLGTINEKLKELNELRTKEEMSAGSMGAALTELQSKEMEIEQNIAEKDRALMSLQENVTEAESERARVSERIISLEKEALNAEEQAASLRGRLENIDIEKARLRTEREELEKKVEELSEEVNGADSTHREKMEKINILERQLEENRNSLSTLREERSQTQNTLARLEAEAESLRNRKTNIETRHSSLFENEETLQKEVNILKDSLENLKRDELDLKERLAGCKKGIEDARRTGEECERELSRLQSERSSRTGRLSTLKELEASMSGFHRGVRAAMEGKKRNDNMCSDIEGIVADIFVAQPDVAVAIETALGGSQQNVITNTARGARDAIEYLKRNRAGRATFLPLDKIRGRKALSDQLVNLPGVVGEAIDLVDFDDKYMNAAEYLLGGILIVENLDRALQLRNNEGRGLRMVTLEGDLINPSGAMTGGKDSTQKGGLITRKSEMEELEAQMGEINSQISEAEAKRDKAIQKLMTANGIINELEEKLNFASENCRQKESEFSGKNAELTKLKEESGNIGGEISGIDTRVAEIEATSVELTQKLEDFATRETELSEAVLKASPEITEARRNAESGSEELTALKVRYAESTQKLGDVIERLENMEKDVEERLQEADYCDQRAASAREEREKLSETIEALKESVADLLQKRTTSEEAINTLRQELGNLKAEIEEKRENEKAANKRSNDIVQSINTLQLDERESTLKLQAISEKVKEELDIESVEELIERMEQGGFGEEDEIEELENVEVVSTGEGYEEEEQAEEEKEPELSEAELATLVAEIQEKIRKLGPVNHQAIEELAELKARNEFLSCEREDLDGAKQDLEELIGRLNNECRKRFDETFENVKENFQLLFRRLFGGGKADLILEECEDPLDAGIEIIARPPGKEPKAISLLSGGEKALCAVALLFSIFRSKPSPFCILDEVDGPLDESNIDRYMDAVREFSQESQFIIITHSKRTMSMTDIIYGVTQAEPGVSTKMSLKFEQGEVTEEEEKVEVA
jgi:chromosome segregation protein